MKIGFIGAGRWGISLALILTRKHQTIKMWEFNAERVSNLNKTRRIPELPENVTIPESIIITNNLPEVINDADILVFVIPSQTLRSTLDAVYGTQLKEGMILVSAIKGIEQNTLKRMSQVIREKFVRSKPVVLAGPGIPYEVVAGMPTSLVAASEDNKGCAMVQELFSLDNLRVYSHSDVIGVELGGALKNVIAIAAGICDGLELGINTKAALLTRGLAEMTRLGIALNANPMTFAGLSGMGDLIVTSFSVLSRNHQVGVALAKGKKISEILSNLAGIAEGVETSKSALGLANKFQVELPLTQEINLILFEDASPKESIERLLKRKLKSEIWR